jgi:hypothetical protein
MIPLEEKILTAKGLAAAKRCWSPLNLAAETIFIDFVIFEMFVVDVMRDLTVIKHIPQIILLYYSSWKWWLKLCCMIFNAKQSVVSGIQTRGKKTSELH